jgi:putative membrane protein
MTDSSQRKPASFRIEKQRSEVPQEKERQTAPRKPQAIRNPAQIVVATAEDDPFSLPDPVTAPPPDATPLKKRRSLAARMFLGAAGALVSLGVGLWVNRLVDDLFSRADWLGWLASGLVAIAVLSLLVIIGREITALWRLASVTQLRRRASDVLISDDAKQARTITTELLALLAHEPRIAGGRERLDALKDDIIDGRDLLALTETELMRPLDERARTLILDAAKRVSVVTAVSPRALVDVGYVLFEAGRLIRQISQLYGGRPGFAGFLRLARRVAGHLAVTGSIAVGDSIVQQVIGHGLAARLSSRLGEGVVNGLMTARIGIAAMDVARPMPFNKLKRPGIGDFLSNLARFSARSANRDSGREE